MSLRFMEEFRRWLTSGLATAVHDEGRDDHDEEHDEGGSGHDESLSVGVRRAGSSPEHRIAQSAPVTASPARALAYRRSVTSTRPFAPTAVRPSSPWMRPRSSTISPRSFSFAVT